MKKRRLILIETGKTAGRTDLLVGEGVVVARSVVQFGILI